MAMDNLLASIGAIHKENPATCSDVKEQVVNFREDVNGKLNEIVADLKETRDRAKEALQRVSDMEEWTAVAKEVLLETLSKQVQIQAKLTILETRSRRNNI